MSEEKKEIENDKLADNIKELINGAKQTTEDRAKYFNLYFDFVLQSDQWYEDEKAEKKAADKNYLTFNSSENYFEEYLARLFPRNPHTGVMEIGVAVRDKDTAARAKYEAEILKTYGDNYMADILLEQGQNFLIGGVACLFYPKNKFGSTDIISLDPKTVYLGWRGKKLIWFAYKDEETEKINYCDKNLFVVLDLQFNYQSHFANQSGFIPFSWVPNMPAAHTHEGRTKIASLFELDREFNKRMSDFSSRIEENTDPHRVVFSDDADEKKIKRGKGKTTVLGKDDDMKHLELKEGQEILDYIEKVNYKIKEKSGLVDTQGIVKQGVSGLSLSYQYSGMLDRIAFMRVYWDRAFREMNKAILIHAFGPGEYQTKPVYNSALIYDSKSKVDEYAIMLDMGIISLRDAIDELRGVENADEKLKEIMAEREKYNLSGEKKDNFKYEKLNNLHRLLNNN